MGLVSSKLGRETRSNTSRFARSASGVTTSFRKRLIRSAAATATRPHTRSRARARRRWPRATRVVKKPSNRRLSRGTRGGIPAASATRCFAQPSRGTAGRSPRAPSMRRTRPWVPRHCPSARTRPLSASARDMRCHRARTRPSVPARTTGPRVTPLWDRSPSPFAQTPPSSPSIARTDGPTFRRTPPTRAGRKPSPRALPRRRHLRRSLTRPRTSARRRSGPPRDGTCATAAPVPETPRHSTNPRSRDVLPGDLDARPRCGIPIPGNGHFRGEFPGAAWEGVPHPRARARDVRVVFAGTRDGDERRRGRLKPATVPLRRSQRARVQIRRWGSLLPDSRRGDGRRVVPLQSRSGGVPSLVRARALGVGASESVGTPRCVYTSTWATDRLDTLATDTPRHPLPSTLP